MHLFGGKFCVHATEKHLCSCDEILAGLCKCDRKNFDTLQWSLVTVFQVNVNYETIYETMTKTLPRKWKGSSDHAFCLLKNPRSTGTWLNNICIVLCNFIITRFFIERIRLYRATGLAHCLQLPISSARFVGGFNPPLVPLNPPKFVLTPQKNSQNKSLLTPSGFPTNRVLPISYISYNVYCDSLYTTTSLQHGCL